MVEEDIREGFDGQRQLERTISGKPPSRIRDSDDWAVVEGSNLTEEMVDEFVTGRPHRNTQKDLVPLK